MLLPGVTKLDPNLWRFTHSSIRSQCYISILPVNIRKPWFSNVFRERNVTLGRKRLICKRLQLERWISAKLKRFLNCSTNLTFFGEVSHNFPHNLEYHICCTPVFRVCSHICERFSEFQNFFQALVQHKVVKVFGRFVQ